HAGIPERQRNIAVLALRQREFGIGGSEPEARWRRRARSRRFLRQGRWRDVGRRDEQGADNQQGNELGDSLHWGFPPSSQTGAILCAIVTTSGSTEGANCRTTT